MNTRPKCKLSPGEKAQMFALAGLVCLVLYWTRPASTHPMRPLTLRVTFLDVGRGDAAVIESPSGFSDGAKVRVEAERRVVYVDLSKCRVNVLGEDTR